MRVAVLVTSMYQTDASLYNKMNLQTDSVIANQTETDEISVNSFNDNSVKLISTRTRGVSRNRNIAIAHVFQDTDIVLFSDDDLIFNDGYEKLICDEFKKHPNAEAIKFNLHDLSQKRKITMRKIERYEKATRRNMSSSGVCGVAIKIDALVRSNIKFREDFGPGTDNYCGEDIIFLQEMINKKIKFFRSPIDIAGIDQSESSWFKGYDAKYFIVTGKVFAVCYPKLCKLLAIRSSWRFSKRKNCVFSFFELYKFYRKGIAEIRKKRKTTSEGGNDED